MAHPTNSVVFSFKNQNQEKPLCQRQGLCPLTLTQRKTSKTGTADIFRRFMVSLYVKGKENGHVQAYAPNGAMVLKRRVPRRFRPTPLVASLPVTKIAIA